MTPRDSAGVLPVHVLLVDVDGCVRVWGWPYFGDATVVDTLSIIGLDRVAVGDHLLAWSCRAVTDAPVNEVACRIARGCGAPDPGLRGPAAFSAAGPFGLPASLTSEQLSALRWWAAAGVVPAAGVA